MKKYLIVLAFLWTVPCFGQGSVYSTTIVNRIGQLMAGASFATCTAAPTGTSLCQGTSLATTYTSVTIGTPCTNVSTATGPTSGVGCTNPGLSDSGGNVIVFSTPAVRWAQISGYQITSETIPFAFAAVSSGAVSFTTITSGTNNSAAMVVGSGASMLATGTGQIRATGSAISSTGVTAPSPLATSACPAGEAPFIYGLNGSGNYQDLESWNTSTTPPTPAGQITFCWPFQYNDSGVSIPSNRAFAVTHTLGKGGLQANSASDESAIMGIMNNLGVGQSVHQFLTFYGEADLSGSTLTFGAHAGGEASVSVFRGNHTNAASSITGGGGFWVFSGQYEHDGASVPTTTGVYHAYLSSNGGSGNQGGQIVRGYNCQGGFAGTETNYSAGCFVAALTQPRYPTNNYGFLSQDFGSNANDFDMVLVGTNSAGAASGFNAIYGPTTFGRGLAQAAAGYQIDVLGAVKVKAGAGVSLIDFYGSTSGHAGIGVPAAAGAPNFIMLPTTTATVTTSGVSQAIISDGANPQQLAYQWHAPVMSLSGTIQTAGKIVKGRCTLGTDCAVTLTGNAVFTSSSTYECSGTDTTAANAVRFNPSSGSAFALTGTGTDVISWKCAGN